MSTLYGKGDRVRARSITSEMPAVIVKGDLDNVPPTNELWCRKTQPAVVIRYIYHIGQPFEKMSDERTIPRRHILGRYVPKENKS